MNTIYTLTLVLLTFLASPTGEPCEVAGRIGHYDTISYEYPCREAATAAYEDALQHKLELNCNSYQAIIEVKLDSISE